MFAPTTFAAALVMTVLSTVFWGSWANTFKLTKNYRFELFYWDYAAGIFLISVVLALTMGSARGADTAFLANLHCAAPINLLWAAIGGFIFNIDRKRTRLNSSHVALSRMPSSALKKNK